jgi:hypothetical protein
MMSKRVIDYNPLTGESASMEFRGDQMVITHEQDVTSIIERAKAWAKKEEKTAYGIKNDLWHYARVPNIVILEMKQKYGVDFYDPNDRPKVFALLNSEYSYCKTTHKNHSIRHA